MFPTNKYSSHILKTFLLTLLFILTLTLFAWGGYQAFLKGSAPGLSLDSTMKIWYSKAGEADAAAYLRVAKNYAEGHGISHCLDLECLSGKYAPFYYWTPGTPFVLGNLIKLTHRGDMWQFFWFVIFAQSVATLLAVATVSLFTKNFLAKALTIIASGLAIPMQTYYFTVSITASEVVAIIPFALTFYFLTRAIIRFWQSPKLSKDSLISAVFAGLSLALVCLVRDSNVHFATFFLFAFPGLAFLRDRSRAKSALVLAAIVFFTLKIALIPALVWNKHRIGNSILASGGDVFKDGLWQKHDAVDWYFESGIGFAQYLDPEAAVRINAAYAAGKGNTWMSMKAFLKGVAKHPFKALTYKLARLPQLLLGTRPIPWSVVSFISIWTSCFYLGLVVYVFLGFKSGSWAIETLYLYPLFLLCAGLFMHFEFRYSFPNWFMLSLVPGLLWATAAETIYGVETEPQPNYV